MRHGSLFSGIGGFDLAAEWMGWENVFHCEWMEFPRKVLEYHFPNADSLIDICKTDFKKYANKIDIFTGGFPCQPFSMAGKRKGTKDERYLWGEMLRAIQEIKPKYVIAENVFGITNIDGGMVFEQVCIDLEAEGYEVQAFIIPAAAKNAPHRRDRCWFVGIKNATDNMSRDTRKGWDSSQGCSECSIVRGKAKSTRIVSGQSFCNRIKETRCESCGNIQKFSNSTNATDTNSNGLNKCDSNDEINTSQGGEYAQRDIEQSDGNGDATDTTSTGRGQDNRIRKSRFNDKKSSTNDWSNFPTQSPICGGDDGLPTELDGITFSKWRSESIKGYGNAICPQIAHEIFKQL